MKRLLGLVSPWALVGIALWIIVMAVVTNWGIRAFASVGHGPECAPPPCQPGYQPGYLPIDWFPVLGTAFVVATVAVGLLAGTFVIVRRISRQ